MKPVDYRNANFEQLKNLLTGRREAVWRDWQAYERHQGARGATTREVCGWAGRDLLQFRPRCTELYQLGVLMLADPDVTPHNSHEGRYRLRNRIEWEQWFHGRRAGAISAQQQLL